MCGIRPRHCGSATTAEVYSVEIATKYAFNFGRNPSEHTDADTEAGIGIYGIGMKRALFKMGRRFDIQSHTKDNAFKMKVNVDKWAAGCTELGS